MDGRVSDNETEEKDKSAFPHDTSPKDIVQLQLQYLAFILYQQFCSKFSIRCFKHINCSHNQATNFSKELLEPFYKYNILQITGLSEEKLYVAMLPLIKCIQSFFKRSTDLKTQIAFLSTLISFGNAFINEAELYTDVHTPVVESIENAILQLLYLMVGIVSSPITMTIDSENFTFAPDKKMPYIIEEISKFLSIAQSFNIQNEVLIKIIDEAYLIVDTMVFNAIIQFVPKIDDAYVRMIGGRIKALQHMISCFLPNCFARMPNLENFVLTAASLINGTFNDGPSPLARSIAERIIPPMEDLDSIGPITDYSTFIVEMKNRMKFTFDEIRKAAFADCY